MFWFATMAPLAVCAILMVIIFRLDGLSFAVWDSVNIGIAYTHFKVPLVIASLAFPLGAVVIASHRSAQTLMMANLQSSQNKFANYFLHLDRFTKALEKGALLDLSVSLKSVHDNFYPDLLEDGVLELNRSPITIIASGIEQLNNEVVGMADQFPSPPHYIDGESTGERRAKSLTHNANMKRFLKTGNPHHAAKRVTEKLDSLVFGSVLGVAFKVSSAKNLDELSDQLNRIVKALNEIEAHDGSEITTFKSDKISKLINYMK